MQISGLFFKWWEAWRVWCPNWMVLERWPRGERHKLVTRTFLIQIHVPTGWFGCVALTFSTLNLIRKSSPGTFGCWSLNLTGYVWKSQFRDNQCGLGWEWHGSFHLDGFSKLHQSQLQNLVSMNKSFIHWRVVPAMLTMVNKLFRIRCQQKKLHFNSLLIFVSGIISMLKRPYLQQSTSSLAGAGRAECAGNWCSNKWRNPAAPLYQQALCWETGGPLC